jgi:hypothetical protein
MAKVINLTKFNLIMLSFFAFFATVESKGGDIDAAIEKRNQAQNDYYTELKKLGRNATPAQKDEVRARTILSATFDLVDSVHRSEVDHSKQTRKAIHDSYQAKFSGQEIPKWVTDPRSKMPPKDGVNSDSKKGDTSKNLKNEKSQKKIEKETTSPEAKPSGTPARKEKSTSERESITLDGSKVPKEIEFKNSNSLLDEKSQELPARDPKGLDGSKVPAEIEFPKAN